MAAAAVTIWSAVQFRDTQIMRAGSADMLCIAERHRFPPLWSWCSLDVDGQPEQIEVVDGNTRVMKVCHCARRTCHTLSFGGLGFIEPSISWEVVAFSALLELANGIEAQPATVDATMINNVPPIIQADFLSSDIVAPISRQAAAAATTVTTLIAKIAGGVIQKPRIEKNPIRSIRSIAISRVCRCSLPQLSSSFAEARLHHGMTLLGRLLADSKTAEMDARNMYSPC
jgi:hypothetical protein